VHYAELHCHSAFSLLDGASSPEELVERAAELKLTALALTDHDDLGGAIRFAAAAKEAGVDGIIGAELSLEGEYHLTLLAKTLQGYKNICSLITGARMRATRGSPRVTFDELSAHTEGIVALSGCPHGAVPSMIARSRFEDAEKELKALVEIFGNDLFVELWDHHLAQESIICRRLIELSKKWSVPYLVTNNVHYAHPDKRIIHDVLTCLRYEVTLSTAGRKLRPNGSWYLKSPQEMHQQWQNYPEALSNTLVVAERCTFRLGLLKPALPEIDLARAQNVIQSNLRTNEIDTSSSAVFSMSRNEILQSLTWRGARERYGAVLSEAQIRQLNHELDLITRLDLAPYFLIMWDIVQFAESHGIAVQGRGSAANSAVCYCLKITAVDPIAMDLLFERFISEDRNEPPDIDLDIAHQEREKVLQYVYEKYGRDHAAMVCEHITYRGPSAVRDAARVFDFSPEQQDKLAAQAHHHEADGAAASLADGGAARAGLDPRDRKVQLLIKVVQGLHQLPRHRSIHVGGFVLSGEPIGNIVPVEPASMPGRTVIQWDKDDLDLAGLIKIDLLGLGMLTLLQEGVKLIQQHRNFKLDLAKLEMSDQNIYQMMQKADTIGVFQIESRAQMSILPKIRPRCFYDVVVSIAIVRPGPIQGNIVHPYLRRRRGLEEVTYLHPSIEPILKRTLGVPLFQEQGMRLAIVAAGFTASQADQLRRVMSHKRSVERMAKVCVQLAEGMRANGLSEEAVETITFQLKAFANYGFPESHAASFALLVFASAYMKYYYAPEFYCAILNAQPMGFYSPATLIRDAIRHNVEVRPVDLAHSYWDCTLEDKPDEMPALRIGLRYVLGLGPKAKVALERAWNTGGRFSSLEDVCKRSGLREKDLQRLAQAGAFESFCKGRRQALWKVLKVIRKKREMPLVDYFDSLVLKQLLSEQQVKSDQDALRRANDDQIDTAIAINDASELQMIHPSDNYITPMTDMEVTVADFNIMGLSTGDHPMVFFREWASRNSIISCAGLATRKHGEQIVFAGSVICRQRPHTAKGFVFMTLEDETGTANVIINPQVFENFREEILHYNFVAIEGRLQLEDGVVNVIASSVRALPRLAAQDEIRITSRDFH
jgi:error-prone DNA polymerase